MRCLLLLFLLAGIVLAINEDQIKGFKELLKNMKGVFATCNLVLFSDLVQYDEADQNCKDFDIGGNTARKNYQGNLATVSDADKNTDMTIVLEMAYPNPSGEWAKDEWVWAGLRKIHHLGDPIEFEVDEEYGRKPKYNASDWAWADGKPLGKNDYTNWDKHQPDQQTNKEGEKQHQMRINHAGFWDDTFKSKIHPYACDYQGKYIISATHKSWHEAKKGCEAAGLIFAKVRNDNEALEMKEAAEHFIGPIDHSLKTFDSDNWLWIGGSDAEEKGSWVWVADGTPIKYTKDMDWQPRKHGKFQPDHASRLKGSDAVQHYLSFSKWGKFDDSYDSEERQRPFACQCPGT